MKFLRIISDVKGVDVIRGRTAPTAMSMILPLGVALGEDPAVPEGVDESVPVWALLPAARASAAASAYDVNIVVDAARPWCFAAVRTSTKAELTREAGRGGANGKRGWELDYGSNKVISGCCSADSRK